MPFNIPNSASAFNTLQAELDNVDVTLMTLPPAQNGVISGCAVTASGTNLVITVAAGAVDLANTYVAVAGGTVTLGAADATNPRFDLIGINASGTVTATAGTPAAHPVFPSLPATTIILAAVLVPATATALTTANNVVDKRITIIPQFPLVYNVKAYGAIGDGVTNDTTAIQSAITDATASGGTIHFPGSATYATTGLVIQSKANFTLQGGRGAVLTILGNTVAAPNQGSANVLTIADSTDFQIQGLTINGMRDTKFPIVLLAANAAAGQASVQVAPGASSVFVVGQRLNLCGGLTVNSGNDANKQDSVTIQSITPGGGGNDTITFTTNLANAYNFLAASTISDGYGNTVAGGAYLTFWQTGTATVAGRTITQEDQQQGIHLMNCKRFAIQGNAIYGIWESGIRCGSHILSAGGAQNDGCSYGTISGNIIYHCFDQGIGLWCSQHITVTGNTISAAGWAAICSTGSDHCTITGNICNDSMQRIPGDPKAGHGVVVEGGVGNMVSGNKINNPYGIGINMTALGTLPFGGPLQVVTAIAAGSNAVALPTATINVGSTSGFASSGQITILSSAGATNVTYTGTTGTSFTGCTGGQGTLFTNQRLTQYPVFLNNAAALAIGSTSTTVSDGTKFQTNGRYSIIDGPKTERIWVTAIAGNVLTLQSPTQFAHADQCQIGQVSAEGNVIQGNAIANSGDSSVRLASAVRTVISDNIIDRCAVAAIDLILWASGGLMAPHGTVITNNQITAPDTSNNGAYYQAIICLQAQNLLISGNRCGGALSTSSSYVTIMLQACSDCVVSNNTVEDTTGVGIKLDTPADWVNQRIQVIGNKVARCLGEGILLYGADVCVVSNNLVSNCASNGGPGGFGGGLDLRGVTNCQITGNQVIDNGRGGLGLDGATINGATVYCTGNLIANNVCASDGKGIDPYNGNAVTQGTGIKELSAGQGPNTYLSNLVYGNTTNWTITSTGNTLRGNQNYNPRGVLGPPAVPASGTAYTNAYNVDALVSVSGGTVTGISIGGVATGLTSGAFMVPANTTIAITYSVAPAWAWYGN